MIKKNGQSALGNGSVSPRRYSDDLLCLCADTDSVLCQEQQQLTFPIVEQYHMKQILTVCPSVDTCMLPIQASHRPDSSPVHVPKVMKIGFHKDQQQPKNHTSSFRK